MGYFAKVVHDVIKIPIIRRDLHAEVVSLNSQFDELKRSFTAVKGQNDLLKSHLDKVLGQLSESSSTLHELRSLPDGLRTLRRAQVSIESHLSSHVQGRAAETVAELKDFAARYSDDLQIVRAALSSLAARADSYVPRERHEELRKDFNHLRDHAEHFLRTVRSELLAEVSSKLASQGAPTGQPITPRIINPGKLLQFTDGIRLNLGSGPIPLRNYLNVDSRELRDVDILADVENLPFGPESVTEFLASHLLEHFKEPRLKESLLPYWRSLLKPGGIFRIIVPDAEGMLQQYANSEISFEHLRLITFGGQDYGGNYHFTMFSRDGLRTLLAECGFETKDYSAVARPNGDCLEMEIIAKKTGKPSD